MHREGFEPSQLFANDSFTDCLPSPIGGRCVINTAIQFSNIKSKRSGYTLDLPMIQA
jgi:hypothetical protein